VMCVDVWKWLTISAGPKCDCARKTRWDRRRSESLGHAVPDLCRDLECWVRPPHAKPSTFTNQGHQIYPRTDPEQYVDPHPCLLDATDVSDMLLTRLKPSQYMSGFMALWAVVSACSALAQNFTGLLLTRFFLGIAEAPFYPVRKLLEKHGQLADACRVRCTSSEPSMSGRRSRCGSRYCIRATCSPRRLLALSLSG
jgi:hypothetical protein